VPEVGRSSLALPRFCASMYIFAYHFFFVFVFTLLYRPPTPALPTSVPNVTVAHPLLLQVSLYSLFRDSLLLVTHFFAPVSLSHSPGVTVLHLFPNLLPHPYLLLNPQDGLSSCSSPNHPAAPAAPLPTAPRLQLLLSQPPRGSSCSSPNRPAAPAAPLPTAPWLQLLLSQPPRGSSCSFPLASCP
jgi:hypothetical protein